MMKLYKKDIKKIGFGIYQTDDGNCIFECTIDTANIEEILLREILALGGYKILYTLDGREDKKGRVTSIDIVTNLPWIVLEEWEK